ncbi:hypothetical protein DUT91_21240 [Phyllobacterium salinisoli]|uniref:Uncharacterized protein n=1 Tax=Phyllobacterium salinisoli TaxID=1899321 RepID=A0A368JYF4_9HYPH|nr:hypothetical protein DUT91_21240 [Phyllobacterium salinisoli]
MAKIKLISRPLELLHNIMYTGNSIPVFGWTQRARLADRLAGDHLVTQQTKIEPVYGFCRPSVDQRHVRQVTDLGKVPAQAAREGCTICCPEYGTPITRLV